MSQYHFYTRHLLRQERDGKILHSGEQWQQETTPVVKVKKKTKPNKTILSAIGDAKDFHITSKRYSTCVSQQTLFFSKCQERY